MKETKNAADALPGRNKICLWWGFGHTEWIHGTWRCSPVIFKDLRNKKSGSNSDTGQLYMNGHFYHRYLKKEKSYSKYSSW